MAKLLLSPPNRFNSLNRATAAGVHLVAGSSVQFRCSPPPSAPRCLFLRSSPSPLLGCSRRRSVLPASSSPSSSSFSSSSPTDEAKGVDDVPTTSSSSGDVDGTASGAAAAVGVDAERVAVDVDKSNGGPVGKQEYPSGEFKMVEFDWWRRFLVRLRMLFALPWERVRKGSVLSMKLKGTVSLFLSSSLSLSRWKGSLCLRRMRTPGEINESIKSYITH